MFYTDWFFLLLLIGLPALSFLSIDPPSLRYSPELFFSALGCTSIVVLAWERIASSRMEELRRLMKRIYLDDGEINLHQTLRSICNYVRGCQGLSGEEWKKIDRAISILERSGCFHRIDRLYPNKALEELRELAPWVEEYHRDWDEMRNGLVAFAREERYPNLELLWAMVRRQVELREEEGVFVPYLKGSMSRAGAYAELTRERGEKAIALIEMLTQESTCMSRIVDHIWKREILERASRIRYSFTSFLVAHGIERPTGSDEDWVEGGGVLDRTGPAI